MIGLLLPSLGQNGVVFPNFSNMFREALTNSKNWRFKWDAWECSFTAGVGNQPFWVLFSQLFGKQPWTNSSKVFVFFFSGGISAAILLPGLVVRNPGGAGGCLASPSDLVQKHGAEMMGVRWHPILCARELYWDMMGSICIYSACQADRGCGVCLLFVNLEYPLQKILTPSPSWLRNQFAFYWCSSGWFSRVTRLKPFGSTKRQWHGAERSTRKSGGTCDFFSSLHQILWGEMQPDGLHPAWLIFFHPICAVEFIQSPASCRGRVYIWWSPQCKTNHPMNL